ncbi:hypothetical protein HanRHA438_Chr09g0382401 [Helianthus annuus]|nr:hypothetical protein HanRHA438_Chr09g0382401 [Helianthus annuus]
MHSIAYIIHYSGLMSKEKLDGPCHGVNNSHKRKRKFSGSISKTLLGRLGRSGAQV